MNAAQSGGHTGGASMGKKSSQMEELVAISSERRNWRGIFIALLVIAAVFSLIIFSIFLLTPVETGLRLEGRRMELSDILGDSLQWTPFNGTWLNDMELVYRDPTGGLSILNLENYTISVLMTNTTFRQLNAESFVVSPARKFVLLQTDSSVEGTRHYVYETQTANTFPLGPTANSSEAPRLQHVMWAPLQAPNLAANATTIPASNQTAGGSNSKSFAGGGGGDGGEHGQLASNGNGSAWNAVLIYNQAISFVYENDIYYKPKVQGELIHRITTTGHGGIVYNGIPDWTYSNIPELDNKESSLAFSPNGHYMAFLTFNDSQVLEYKYTWMGDDVKYPAVLKQRYPKAGSNNPNVTVNVVKLTDLNNLKPRQIKLPPESSNCSYIGALTWSSTFDLTMTVTNRAQTKASTVICRAPNFYCQILHTEVIVNDGWVLPAERPIFSSRLHLTRLKDLHEQENATNFHNFINEPTNAELSNGVYILKRLPVRDGEHGHFRHVVFISSIDRRPVPLTMGRYEVTELIAWDEFNEIVYFMATPEQRASERHLYSINLKLNITKMNRTYISATQPTCLTCNNTAETFQLRHISSYHGVEYEEISLNPNAAASTSEDEHIVVEENDDDGIPKNCLFNKIYFSKNFSYYVQECLGPATPSVYLVDTKTNMKIFVLDSGDLLRERVGQLAVPQVRTMSVELNHGFNAQVRLFMPPGEHDEEAVAFPLILHVDSAPGSQLVTEKFHVDWNWYLSSQRSFIVAQIDGRGSGFQGELLRTQVHGKLGTAEIEDQLSVLSYLRDNVQLIDPSRVCAYGWGYGGYASIMTLIEDSQQILQCGVAINPIVSFGYHYSFFTERYIPLKGDYLRALQEADLTMKVSNLKGRNLMLMHGTADTLVHQEHTLMLVRSLVDQQIKFRHQVYPDENHGLTKSLSHVYKTMEWYFDECFGPNDDDNWDPTGLFVFKQ